MKENNRISIDTVIENLISIHPLLKKSFSKAIRSKTNLNPGSLHVLGILNNHKVLSMSEIGCSLSMPKSHITGLVDKLIAENMVERLYDPKDRRIVNVHITEKGIADFNDMKQEISQDLRRKLEKLDADTLHVFSESSQHVKDILESIVQEQTEISITT